jgi:hypothetical protein
MRFLSIYKAAETNVPPTTEEMAKMGQLIEEMTKAGTLLVTEGCLPTSKGARVRRSGGKVTVTDGPFTESKEVVAGFALLEANSKEEAIELTRRFLEVVGEGECELRQIAAAEDFGAEFTPELREQEERSREKMAAKR